MSVFLILGLFSQQSIANNEIEGKHVSHGPHGSRHHRNHTGNYHRHNRTGTWHKHNRTGTWHRRTTTATTLSG